MVNCKIDEDLPVVIVDRLRQHGNEVTSVKDQNLCGSKDSELWRVVQQEGRLFITADKGFGDIRLYPPGSHHGVLLLRPDDEGVNPLQELIIRLLNVYTLDDLRGTICVVTPRGVRIRRA